MGTILVVAVVIVLAGVVGVTSYGFVQELNHPAPNVAFAFEWDQPSRTLTITHDGGAALTAANTDRLAVVVRDGGPPGPSYGVARADWTNQSVAGAPVDVGDGFTVTGESRGGDLDVERRGSAVGTPGGGIHQPAQGDVVEVYWYGPDGRRVRLVEHVIGSVGP